MKKLIFPVVILASTAIYCQVGVNNSTSQNWFNAGEPNNSGGNEGSCHIWTTASFANRKWNDINGTTANSNGPFNQTIVEFNEE